MFVLSSSDRRQWGFTTYLGQLKNCCPKFLPSLSASLHSQLAKAAKKTNFKKKKKHVVDVRATIVVKECRNGTIFDSSKLS
jgi:hypothetical protein